MSFTPAKLWQQICIADPQITVDQRRKLYSSFKIKADFQKMYHLHKELNSIIITLLTKKTLNQTKLNKVLSYSITLNEAMFLKLTNFYSYIMQLIRQYKSTAARAFLNQLTEQINKYEDLLHKKIEKQVQRYRKLDDDNNSEDNSQRDDSSSDNLNAKEKEREKKEIMTLASGIKKYKEEELRCTEPGTSRQIYFNRISKQDKK